MLRNSFGWLCALSFAATAAGCAPPDADDDAWGKVAPDDDFAALATGKADFASEMRIVGDLPLGASESFYHSGKPRYRALRVTADAGSKLDIWVRSSDGDPVAWLLDDNFKIVAHSDDTGESLNSHMTLSAPGGMTYLVVRDYDDEAANFKVTLKGTKKPGKKPVEEGGVEGEQGEGSYGDSFFDPNRCSGEPLTKSEMVALIPLPYETSVQLGRFDYATRARTCYPSGGCTAWTALNGAPNEHYRGLAAYGNWVDHYTLVTRHWAYVPIAAHGGTVSLELSRNLPRLRYTGDTFAFELFGNDYSEGISGISDYLSAGNVTDEYQEITLGGQPVQLGGLLGSTGGTQGKSLEPEGLITAHCMRLSDSYTVRTRDAAGNQITKETEFVMLMHY